LNFRSPGRGLSTNASSWRSFTIFKILSGRDSLSIELASISSHLFYAACHWLYPPSQWAPIQSARYPACQKPQQGFDNWNRLSVWRKSATHQRRRETAERGQIRTYAARQRLLRRDYVAEGHSRGDRAESRSGVESIAGSQIGANLYRLRERNS
jgi:hypothetical protein